MLHSDLVFLALMVLWGVGEHYDRRQWNRLVDITEEALRLLRQKHQHCTLAEDESDETA